MGHNELRYRVWSDHAAYACYILLQLSHSFFLFFSSCSLLLRNKVLSVRAAETQIRRQAAFPFNSTDLCSEETHPALTFPLTAVQAEPPLSEHSLLTGNTVKKL